MSHLKRQQQQQVVNACPLNAFGNSSGFLYGDPAYTVRVHLQGPFKGAIITPQMQAFNSAISTVRISVECLFGNITNYFKFVDFKKNLKICLSSVGKMYIVCAILHNALTCLYGNQTSSHFDLNPPSLQEYFV